MITNDRGQLHTELPADYDIDKFKRNFCIPKTTQMKIDEDFIDGLTPEGQIIAKLYHENLIKGSYPKYTDGIKNGANSKKLYIDLQNFQ